MASRTKKILLSSLIFLGISFICVIVVFYFLGTASIKNAEETKSLQEQLTMMEIEKSNTEDELSDVKERLNSIELPHILKRADEVYGDAEKNRREGLLWIDRDADTYVVTLGALNGLKPGNRLSVFDEKSKKLGQVVVDTPLDVISYVRPVDNFLKDSEDDQFRVSME